MYNKKINLKNNYAINFNIYMKVLFKHKGNYLDYYETLQNKEKSNFLLNLNKNLDDDINNIITKYQKNAKNAEVVSFSNGKFIYKNEQNGIKISKENLIKDIFLNKNNTNILLKKEIVLPKISKKDLMLHNKKMAEFTTNFETSTSQRKQNIKIASNKIDNTIVYPNCNFSFNKVVGQRDEKNGFVKAKIIYNGELIEGIGGGVCQVSSTLYVAWVKAGLAVKSSRSHTQKVSYIKQGLDTTVTQWCDLILSNDTAYPIYIDTIYNDKTLNVILYGTSLNCKIELVVEKYREIISDEYEEIKINKEEKENEENEKITKENEGNGENNKGTINNIEWQD